MINKILATRFGGSYLQSRWIERYLPQDTRTGDDIVRDLFASAGLSFGEST